MGTCPTEDLTYVERRRSQQIANITVLGKQSSRESFWGGHLNSTVTDAEVAEAFPVTMLTAEAIESYAKGLDPTEPCAQNHLACFIGVKTLHSVSIRYNERNWSAADNGCLLVVSAAQSERSGTASLPAGSQSVRGQGEPPVHRTGTRSRPLPPWHVLGEPTYEVCSHQNGTLWEPRPRKTSCLSATPCSCSQQINAEFSSVGPA
jgi:hypothetical protein